MKDTIREDGREVIIGGDTYCFYNRIGESVELLASFNRLASHTFGGLTFDSAGGYYEPHVLVKDGEVCANISVNQISYDYDGRQLFCIQLGTVMTEESHRHRGLSRWLMEYILEQWVGRCDLLYLYANDTVTAFYPKFGFEERRQFHCYRSGRPPADMRAERLSMDKAEHLKLADEKYRQGNPFSRLCMRENDTLFHFYARRVMKDCVYYSRTHNVLILAEQEADCLWCYDIFGRTEGTLNEILGELCTEEGQKIYLGFIPKESEDFVTEEHIEEDTTFFIHRSSDKIFETDRLMFPVISIA